MNLSAWKGVHIQRFRVCGNSDGQNVSKHNNNKVGSKISKWESKICESKNVKVLALTSNLAISSFVYHLEKLADTDCHWTLEK